MKKKVVILLAILLFIGFIFFSSKQKSQENTLTISINNHAFILEKAITLSEKQQGLMFRKSLPENHGMIFIFNGEETQTFWMKNTLIPLDIIFLDKNLRIVDIKENVQPCRSDPCETYSSIVPAQYVIELNGKTAENIGLKKGDIIQSNNL